MAYEPEHRKLPDGRTVYTSLWTARRWGVVPTTVPAIAERHNVERYAAKSPGGVAYYYLAEDVERVRIERANLQPIIEGDAEFVPAPFKKKSQG